MDHQHMEHHTDRYVISQTSLTELRRAHRRLKGLIHILEKQPESEMDVLDLDEIQALIGYQLERAQPLLL